MSLLKQTKNNYTTHTFLWSSLLFYCDCAVCIFDFICVVAIKILTGHGIPGCGAPEQCCDCNITNASLSAWRIMPLFDYWTLTHGHFCFDVRAFNTGWFRSTKLAFASVVGMGNIHLAKPYLNLPLRCGEHEHWNCSALAEVCTALKAIPVIFAKVNVLMHLLHLIVPVYLMMWILSAFAHQISAACHWP